MCRLNTMPACFSASQRLQLANGEFITMEELSTQSVVLCPSDTHGKQGFERILLFFHQKNDSLFDYLKITTDQNNEIRISDDHYIYADFGGRCDFITAKKCKVGDKLYNQQNQWETIISIEKIQDRGLFAPLSKTGMLYVNNFLVSCYTSLSFDAVLGHKVADKILAPVKKFASLKTKIQQRFRSNSTEHK